MSCSELNTLVVYFIINRHLIYLRIKNESYNTITLLTYLLTTQEVLPQRQRRKNKEHKDFFLNNWQIST